MHSELEALQTVGESWALKNLEGTYLGKLMIGRKIESQSDRQLLIFRMGRKTLKDLQADTEHN